MVNGLGQYLSLISTGSMAALALTERAQAFHIGSVDQIEAENPLAAMTLIRSYAENAAAVIRVTEHPDDLSKLYIGAHRDKFAVGRLISNATKRAPGLKALYAHLSDAAHPAGAGSFHSLQVVDQTSRDVTWTSHPRFRNAEDPLWMLMWTLELCEIHTRLLPRLFEFVQPSGD